MGADKGQSRPNKVNERKKKMSEIETKNEEVKTETCKLQIIVEGMPTRFRAVPHKSDPEKMVLKTCPCEAHKDALFEFCELTNLPAGNRWQGERFFMVEVEKDALLAALMRVLNSEVTVEVPVGPSSAEALLMMLAGAGDSEELPN